MSDVRTCEENATGNKVWETKFSKQNKLQKAVDCFVNILFHFSQNALMISISLSSTWIQAEA